MIPKDYVITKIEGEYAYLREINGSSDDELFIALALLPLGVDIGTKLKHTFTEYISNNDATCTQNGTKTSKCENCDAIDTIIDEGTMKPHNYVNDACDSCGIAAPKITIENTDISISEDEKSENRYAEGIKLETTVSQILESIKNTDEICVVDKNGNTVDTNVTLCTGMKINLIVNDIVVDEITIVIKGEINGDGMITTKDVTLQRRFIANWESDIIESSADIDKDGTISAKDTALIRRYIAGWDVEI